jgi:tRNA A-37 threonylcarbamoyl transferase component Bud32
MEPDAPGRERRPLGRFGRFTILRVIGQGASGSVFEVHDPQLDRRAALKVLRDIAGNDSAARFERFVREGEALARLRHPHVVAVHEAGSSGGIPYVLLELVEGTTLDRAAQAGASPGLLVGYVVQIARGLDAVHRAGIVHRDVKPQNIVVDPARGARLIDFGLARVAEATSLTATGAFLGTPAYVAPEALQGGDVGPAADIYGLGATLFDALTGSPPLAHGGAAPDLRTYAPSVSPKIAQVCRRALAPAPAARWPSAGAFADALEAAAADPAPPRGAVAAWLAVAALLVGVVGVVGGRLARAPTTTTTTTTTTTVATSTAPVDSAAADPPPAAPTLRPWSLVTTNLVESTSGRHAGGVWCAAVTSAAPHGVLVLSGGGDGLVRVWRGADGALVRTLTVAEAPRTGAQTPITSLAGAADGQTLLAFGGGQVTRWNLEFGERLDTWTLEGFTRAASEATVRPDLRLSADGSRGLALAAGEVHVLDPDAAPRTLPPTSIVSIALSPDGRSAALGDREGTVVVWDLNRSTPGRPLQAGRGQVVAVAFDPTGRDVIAGSNLGKLSVFEGAARTSRRVAGVTSRGLRTLVHLGDRIVGASVNAGLCSYTRAPNGVWRLGPEGPLSNGLVEFDATGEFFAMILPGRARVAWRDVATGNDVWRSALPASADAVLPGGDRLVVASGGRLLRVARDASGPVELGRYEGNLIRPAQVAGGKALLTLRSVPPGAGPGGAVTVAQLVDLATGATTGRWDLENPPRCALAPDGATVACVSSGGAVVLWAPDRADPVETGLTSADLLRWADDHTLVVARASGLQVWDLAARRQVQGLVTTVSTRINDLAIGGSTVLLLGARGQTVLSRRLLRTTGEPEDVEQDLALDAPTGTTRLAIDPQGTWAVTADARRAIVWDLRREAPARVGQVEVGADDEVKSIAVSGPRELVVGTDRGVVLRVALVE